MMQPTKCKVRAGDSAAAASQTNVLVDVHPRFVSLNAVLSDAARSIKSMMLLLRWCLAELSSVMVHDFIGCTQSYKFHVGTLERK